MRRVTGTGSHAFSFFDEKTSCFHSVWGIYEKEKVINIMKSNKMFVALVAMLWSFALSASAQVTNETELKAALAAGGEVVLGEDGTAVLTEYPAGVTATDFGDNTVTDGTNYYATLQAAVEAVAGQANAVLYCKPGANVGSLQHAPVTATLTVYGNGANVTGGAERDFDLGNTDPNGGKDITADMTLTVKNLDGCGAWGTKATEHTVNLVFENCANMGKVYINGTTGTLNITMTDCAFEGVLKEAVYSNADGAITLNNVAFSNLNKAINLNHKAAGTQTVTINGCSFTNCGNDVAADQIPVRVLSSVEGGKSVLTVSNTTFTGTPEGGADILLDYGVGESTLNITETAANVSVEIKEDVATTTTVSKSDEQQTFTNAAPVSGLTGEGSAASPYLIKTVEDLILFRNSVNAGETKYNASGVYVALGNDIDLNNEQWFSIGSEATPFKGNFDGGNKTISNLKIHEAEAKEGKVHMGLFGYAKDATIKNITIENVDINIACLDIDHSQGHIGAIAGTLEGTSLIEKVTVKGDIKVEATTTANGASRVAVVVGGNSYANVTMKDVHVIANEGSYLKANNNVGALAGQLQNIAVFEDCSSNIDVFGTKFFAGGLIGLTAGNSTFTNCHTTGNVSVTAGRAGRGNDHYRVGGIAGGWADGKTKVCTLTECSYTGNVSGVNADGSVAETLDYRGFVGRGYTLTNCAGSKVVIDGVEHVQAYDNVYGFYTVDGVYEVNTLAALKAVRDNVNTGADYYEGKTIVLTADIDLAGENWVGIGSATAAHGFMGNFDGKNFKIKNLTITDPAADSDGYVYAGLFSVTEGTDKNNQNVIKNLTIENVTISTTGHIVSAAIAYPYYTIVDNVTVCGKIDITGGDYTAGALAYTRRCVNASDVTVAGSEGSTIAGAQVVGGVISDIQMNGGLKAEYSNFSASGVSITGTKRVGGISGIIATQTLNGATVKNVTLTSGDNCVGIVSGSFGGTCTITDVTYNDVTGADVIIGHTYSEDGPGAAVEAKIGDTYYSTLAEAVKGTGNVELLTDVTLKDDVAYASKSDKQVTGKITYTRTLIAGIWNPIYLPFAVTLSTEDYDVAEFASAAGDILTLNKIKDATATLEANKAYVIRPRPEKEAAKTLTIELTDATLEAATVEAEKLGEGFYVKGNYSVLEGSKLGAYDRIVSKDGEWAKLAGTSTLKPYRLILTIPATASAISMRVEGEDATSIENLGITIESDVIFDLMGRRVETMTEGGIYIVNGKKIVF